MKRTILLIAFIMTVLMVQQSHAALQLPSGLLSQCATTTLPGKDPSYPQDQLVLICIPTEWNNNFVIYAHGYVPPQDPLELPIAELTLADGQTVPALALSLGYAFATTSYHKNGYAVEQAENDLTGLVEYITNVLVPGQVENIYISGASEGGLIAAMLLERYPETYRGGLALCGPVGGAPYQVKYLSDFRLVFDYYYPSVFDFGTYAVPETAFQDWESYQDSIARAMFFGPLRAERLFDVTGAALDPVDKTTFVTTANAVLFYSIWGTNDLIDTAGGRPFDNRFTWYSGSGNDSALNRRIDRIEGDRRAREYLLRFYQTTGNLERPMVTLHTTQDPAVPFKHELIYFAKAVRQGRAHYLTVLPVHRYGHCNFTTQEVLGAFQLLILKTR